MCSINSSFKKKVHLETEERKRSRNTSEWAEAGQPAAMVCPGGSSGHLFFSVRKTRLHREKVTQAHSTRERGCRQPHWEQVEHLQFICAVMEAAK